jgi:hypothetical protein
MKRESEKERGGGRGKGKAMVVKLGGTRQDKTHMAVQDGDEMLKQ